MASIEANDRGDFSRRVDIMRNTPTRGADGSVGDVWASAFRIWARNPEFKDSRRVDNSDRDGSVSGAKYEVARIPAKSILISDRVLDDGITYTILGILSMSQEITRLDCEVER
jgi:hypothetical protein